MLGLSSTVSRGALYEAISCVALPSASWARRGGAGDGGVDLRGSLVLGDKEVPVIIQCKNHANRSPPAHVRELEGTLGAEPGGGKNTIAVLCTKAGCVDFDVAPLRFAQPSG